MMLKILLATLAMLPGAAPLLSPNLMDQSEWKEKLQMGNASSSNETYIVTDWKCPACQMKEADIEKMLPKLLQKSRVYFIDLANHPGSEDYVKYNLSFLLHNKADYLKLRSILSKLSQEGQAPTIEQFPVKYIPLSSSKIDAVNNYFTAVKTALDVHATPTLVFKNVKTNKSKSIAGTNFDESSVMKTLDEIEKP